MRPLGDCLNEGALAGLPGALDIDHRRVVQGFQDVSREVSLDHAKEIIPRGG